jgi:uncharacterized membrane protein (DUF4010 family)
LLPPQITPFLLTLAISFLIGIGLREYYEGEKKFDTFGTVRTFIFIGLLGYILYGIPVPGRAVYLLGMASLTTFLLVYYSHKVRQHKSPGLIGVLIGLLTYAVAPVAIHEPHWFLVAVAIVVLYVLHSKGSIRRLTDRLEAGEVITVCKFLAIAAVVLPLIPATFPVSGMAGRIFQFLPVSPRQVWMAVVITTAISYLGYVLQNYLYPRKGLVLTGVIGGLYSSTMATLVLAKQTRGRDDQYAESSAAILLTTPSMYLRVLLLVAAFQPMAALALLGPFAVLSALISGYAWWVRRQGSAPAAAEPEVVLENKNPLELNAAFIFAVMFVTVSLVTKLVLARFHDLGLQMLSFLVGTSDIVPFIVSVLQGNLGIGERLVINAVIISTASNNLMKAVYAFAFGNRRSALLTACGLGGSALLSFLYAALAR